MCIRDSSHTALTNFERECQAIALRKAAGTGRSNYIPKHRRAFVYANMVKNENGETVRTHDQILALRADRRCIKDRDRYYS